MKTLVKFYSASCVIVVGFFTFFLIPWGLLPFSEAANVITVSVVLIGLAAFYMIYFQRREGLDLGWFLANQGGFWAITIALLGIVSVFCGVLLYFRPGLYAPAFEQGALPFGIMIVSLFWLTLIFMFGYLAVGMIAQVTAHARKFHLAEAAVNLLVALVPLGLAGVFFSLFLEVIDDIAIRISVSMQCNAIWIYVGSMFSAGIIYGFRKNPGGLLKHDEPAEEVG